MPNPQPSQVFLYNGQRVRLQGVHRLDASVWIGHDEATNEQVYVSADWLELHNPDGTAVPTEGQPTPEAAPLPTVVATPRRRAEPAPAQPTPVQAAPTPAPARRDENGEEIDEDDRPVRRPRTRRTECPACEEQYTGTLGRDHACAAVKLARCRACLNVDPAHIERPQRPPYLCPACVTAGKFICKTCARPQTTRGRYGDICNQCNPLPQTNIWTALNNKAKGDDMTIITRSHRPFAVEVESFLMPTDGVAPRARLNGGWHEGSDGSIRADPGATEAVEFKSPPFKGDGGLAMLYTDVKKLRDMGFRANKSCGLHCHVDMISSTPEERKALYQFGKWIQDDIYKLVARSRSQGQYCQKLTTSLDQSQRYLWLNMKHAFERHKTVEFRLHHGTTQPDRVVEWVKVCLRIVEVGLKLGHMSRRPAGTLFELLQFNAYEQEYWMDVARSLHGTEVTFGGGA